VGSETSLELIPHDICMGVVVRFPPVCCCAKKLIHKKQNLLRIRALGDHELLLNSFKPILCFHGILGLRESGGASSQDLSQMRLVWWWRWR
jgi:hypothetical protein